MMQKEKYRFNPNLLTYEKVKLGFKEYLRRFSFYMALSIVLAGVMAVALYKFIDSPKEKSLEREIKQYERQYKAMNSKIESISKTLADMEDRDDNVYRVIFGVDPIAPAVRNSGTGGVDAYSDLKGFDNSSLIVSTKKRLDSLSKRVYVQSESLEDILKIAKDKYNRLASMPAIMPLSKSSGKIVSGFGMRFHPILKYRREHTGIDIAAASGTKVYATGDGVVVASGKNDANYSGYGIYCVIDHGYGFQTLYGHLSQSSVTTGQKVKRGQIIGKVGSTGLSQAPHLHYEVIQNSKKVDPVYYFFNDLSPDEYEKVIEDASRENQCLS